MYHRIMVPVDGSATAERGLKEAVALAGGDTRLLLLHVAETYPVMADTPAALDHDALHRRVCEYGHGVLEHARRTAADAGVQADTRLREMAQGRVADVIVDEANEGGCDLIVMGTHGRRGIGRIAIGSDAESVVRLSALPVLLVRHVDARHERR